MNIREICSRSSTRSVQHSSEMIAGEALSACAESLTKTLFDEFSIQLTTDAPSVHRELERRRRLRRSKGVVVPRVDRVSALSSGKVAASQSNTRAGDASAVGSGAAAPVMSG